MKMLTKGLYRTLALGTVALLAACSEKPITNPAVNVLTPPQLDIIPPDQPDLERLAICKVGPTGTYTFQATATTAVLWDTSDGKFDLTQGTYTITVDDTSKVSIGGQSVQGSCHVFNAKLPIPDTMHDHIAVTGGGPPATSVTVVETGIPAGLAFQKAVTYQRIGSVTTPTTTFTNSATGALGGDPTADQGANIVFYNTAVQGLTVSKTAAGTFDRNYSWTLQKTVSPTSHTGIAGQVAGTSTWTVTATQTVTDNNFQVTGNITITNSNNFPVTVAVTDLLSDNTAGSVTCPNNNVVAANGTLTCSYVAVPTNGNATGNTATVTVTSPSGVTGGTANASLSFTPNVIGDASVLLGDTHLPTLNQTLTGSATFTPPETFSCPSDASQYDSNGDLTFQVPNTATLTGANTNLSANAQVTVACRRPPPPPVCPAATVVPSLSSVTNQLFIFSNGSVDANWQGATKGFSGNVAVSGGAHFRTSGGVPYAGTISTNGSSLGAWQNIVNQNPGQAFAALNAGATVNPLFTSLTQAFATINGLAVHGPAGFNGTPQSLNGLNTQNGINETFVLNVTSGFQVSTKINITGDAGDLFILRWDTDQNFANGYQGQVKFQSGGAIVPLGGLTAANFVHVAGDINASGGGSNPALPYPQSPGIPNGANWNGGGFFTGYWLTTGDPSTGATSSLSNAIFVGGWYSTTSKFSMTSGTSGVHVVCEP